MRRFDFTFNFSMRVIDELNFAQAWEIMQVCEMLEVKTYSMRALVTYLPLTEYNRFIEEVNDYINKLK